MRMLDGGLVLEGGGMRGLYTAGVLDFFMEKDIYFKDCVGVSAGASHATNFLSRQKGRSLNIMLQYLDTKQYASPTAWFLTGNFFDKKFHTKILPNRLVPYDYKTAKKSPMHFYAVVTECESGDPVYHQIKSLRQEVDWIWASGSLPLLAKIVELDGRHYLDGGIADSIPVQFSETIGNEKNVVVLTRDIHYRKEQDKNFFVIQAKYHKYPAFVEAVRTRPQRYNETLEYILEEEKAGRLFVIRPQKPVVISRLEKDKEALLALYKQGYEDASAQYEAMTAFFGKEVKDGESISDTKQQND